MNKYIVFLRGINVGGLKLTQKDLTHLIEPCGFRKIKVFLNSGNIQFQTDLSKDKIKELLDLILPVPYFLMTYAELFRVFEQRPKISANNCHLYIFIAQSSFSQTAMREFVQVKPAENEKALIISDIFFWQVPIGQTLKTNFGKILSKRQFREQFTSRNINTIERIIKYNQD